MAVMRITKECSFCTSNNFSLCFCFYFSFFFSWRFRCNLNSTKNVYYSVILQEEKRIIWCTKCKSHHALLWTEQNKNIFFLFSNLMNVSKFSMYALSLRAPKRKISIFAYFCAKRVHVSWKCAFLLPLPTSPTSNGNNFKLILPVFYLFLPQF